MPDFFVNGQPVHADKGQTVMQAALAAGCYIPYFCWHPNLSIAGNCRVCVVEVEGEGGGGSWTDIACNMPVTEGMRVLTDSPRVQELRRQTLQFILLNHPVDCGICDKAGECLLQDHHYQFNGLPSASTIPKVKATKFVPLSQRIVLDNERCILCSRCVRFTREVSKTDALGIVSRGDTSLVRAAEDGAFDRDHYSDNVIDLCPVGALLAKSFLHQTRVWYLQATRSVCPGCARGCQVDLWHRQPEWQLNAPCFSEQRTRNRIERVTAPASSPERAGDAVDGPWICNTGRDLARFFERPRALQPMLKGRAAPLHAALEAARRLLGAARRPALLVSSWGSNEELAAAARLVARHARAGIDVFVKADRQAEAGEPIADDLLIRADKNPNTRGAQALFGAAPVRFAAGTDVVLVWGEGFAFGDLPRGARTILLNAFVQPENGHADAFIPISVQTERAGSYTQCDGREVRFAPCFDKPAAVAHAEQVFEALAESVAGARAGGG